MKGRALSIRQPWAWLIACGYKDVENRDWPTRVRGVVGIHASKRFDRDGYTWVSENFPEIRMPLPDRFEFGAIIGRAELVDCVRHSLSPWFFGEYGFVFRNADKLEPRACKGSLGFFRPVMD